MTPGAESAPLLDDSTNPQRPTSHSWIAWCALAWLIGFLFYFYGFALPNSPDSAIGRSEIWRQLPFLLLENIDPTSEEDRLTSGWSYLPQRFDLMATAAVILAGAWGLGCLLLRVCWPDVPKRSAEKSVFAFGLGLMGLSLITLGCGVAGLLLRWLLGGLLVAFPLLEIFLRYSRSSGLKPATLAGQPSAANEVDEAHPVLRWTCIATMVPFLLAILLGAMLPSTDFDAKEYHLQGPKEFFEAGRVGFLPHNVYTSFPFLTEMLNLLAMVIRNDWYRGALAGKAVLACFAPLTALAIYVAGRRWFSPNVGWLAATIHLTTPWTYRISIIAGAEGGPTFYLFATMLAVLFCIEQMAAGCVSRRRVLLCGLLAGGAMSCKYPGVVQVVIPLGAVLTVAPLFWKRPVGERCSAVAKAGLVFSAGVLLTIGPWLLKNIVETGNPVYPLLYSVFGGADWNEALNAKWIPAHSPDNYALGDLKAKFIDVTSKSDWLSPLLFGLAPLAVLTYRRRHLVWALWVYVVFLFMAWWLLTHRLDRFWVPLIPVVSLLAGIGAAYRTELVWRIGCGFLMAAAMLFNLGYITTPLCGFNAYLSEMGEAGRLASGSFEYINRSLPPDARVLCVGEAQVFDAQFPLVYNTVFDHSIFEDWFSDENSDLPAGERPLAPPDVIRETLKREQITHILVNWSEVLRYREPGSYGYTEFVAPHRFRSLQELGILGPPQPIQLGDYSRLGTHKQREIDNWGSELKTIVDGKPAWTAIKLFPVVR